MQKTYYNSVSLSLNRMKSVSSAPNVEAENVRDARNECNDVPCVRCAASYGILVLAVALGSGGGIIAGGEFWILIETEARW